MPTKDWNRQKACRTSVQPQYPAVFDTVIIGAGPAGMTAAVYSARRGMKTLFITGRTGGQLAWSSDIRNWTGVIRSTGPILSAQMMSHVKTYRHDRSDFDLYLLADEYVDQITEHEGGGYLISTRDAVQHFLTKTVIVTCGKRPRMLHIPGEDQAQKGCGLSFSATSDAPLYRNKKMVVIGGGNSAMDISLQLAKVTDDITILTNLDHLLGETCLQQRVKQSEKIKVKLNAHVQEIMLDDQPWVRGVRVSFDGGAVQEIACEGVFTAIGQVPSTTWLDGFLDTDERGQIQITRECVTSRVGVFAGGDCCNNQFQQVVVATGQGAICALQAHEFVQRLAKQ